ncbi:hypothetical protein FACS1894130_10990 [Spirochaetia bacterium]|nr:hypothetical protein FACS1894130_10990 [Spirochaetia bacterium]
MPGTKGCKGNGMNTVWKMKKQQPLAPQCQTGVVSVSQKTTTSNIATINSSYNHAKSHPIKYTDPDGRTSLDPETGAVVFDINDVADTYSALAQLGEGTATTAVGVDSASGSSVAFNNTQALSQRYNAALEGNNFDFSSAEAFLETAGAALGAAYVVAELASKSGVAPKGLSFASSAIGVVGTLTSGGSVINAQTKEEGILASADAVVSLIGLFGGVPGASFGLLYTGAKKSAPPIWRACPKVCVNGQKMVEIPREQRWPEHERRKRRT